MQQVPARPKIIPWEPSSSERLRLIVERVVSGVSKDRSVFYLNGRVQARP